MEVIDIRDNYEYTDNVFESKKHVNEDGNELTLINNLLILTSC